MYEMAFNMLLHTIRDEVKPLFGTDEERKQFTSNSVPSLSKYDDNVVLHIWFMPLSSSYNFHYTVTFDEVMGVVVVRVECAEPSCYNGGSRTTYEFMGETVESIKNELIADIQSKVLMYRNFRKEELA